MIAVSRAVVEGLVVWVADDGTELDVDGADVDLGLELVVTELAGVVVEDELESGGELEGVEEHAAQRTANAPIANPTVRRTRNWARAANLWSMPGVSPSGPI